jgi:hypothetical protein
VAGCLVTVPSERDPQSLCGLGLAELAGQGGSPASPLVGNFPEHARKVLDEPAPVLLASGGLGERMFDQAEGLAGTQAVAQGQCLHPLELRPGTDSAQGIGAGAFEKGIIDLAGMHAQ